jgi:UDP-N-acetylmuramoyl-L-alanyl-D-glutamate--2,6-diaminopimelate ligase
MIRCAVTGTAGKTSVCDIVLQLWKFLSIRGASIGTLGVRTNCETEIKAKSNLTTPSPLDLESYITTIKEHNLDCFILEASSHGLKQKRLGSLDIDIAAFTNLSHDHLDYHKTLDDYFQSKKILFRDYLLTIGWSILNADIPEFADIKKLLVSLEKTNLISFGFSNSADLKITQSLLDSGGQKLIINYKNKDFSCFFPLIGKTQSYNFLCAVGILLAQGLNLEDILSASKYLIPIPGRLEYAGTFNKADVYVDYAHKPAALEKALNDLRVFCKSNLHVVFGCGGDRDKEKRPMMGKIAQLYADRMIITDDNPRTENAASVRKDILSECPTALEIGNRKDAIHTALNSLETGDILLIAGKGHEDYQIIGNEKYPFDDRVVVKDFICSKKKNDD